MLLAQRLRRAAYAFSGLMTHADVLRWVFLLLSIGVVDALIQFADYLHCRKEANEAKDMRE
jgi:hypothetical protein